jgi:hypothetical protein
MAPRRRALSQVLRADQDGWWGSAAGQPAAETHFFRKKGGDTLRTTGEATTAKLAATRAQVGKQSPDAAQRQLARIVAGKNDPKKTK